MNRNKSIFGYKGQYLYKCMMKFLSIVGCYLLLTFSGCGKSEEATATSESKPKQQQSKVEKYSPSLATAEIFGKVNFQGEKPEPIPLKVTEKYCIENYYKEKPLLAENVVVNDNNTLRNVFIYVKEGAEKWEFEPPKEEKIIDQRGCKYTPHVFGIQVGQPLKILNSDPFLHNIHSVGQVNPEFNFGQPTKEMATTKVFEYPEIMVKFKCDVHSWMSAYAGVVSHPFYAVTDEKGEFRIKLPPGEYTIEAWHEEYGTQTQKVKVEDGKSVEVNFTYPQK